MKSFRIVDLWHFFSQVVHHTLFFEIVFYTPSGLLAVFVALQAILPLLVAHSTTTALLLGLIVSIVRFALQWRHPKDAAEPHAATEELPKAGPKLKQRKKAASGKNSCPRRDKRGRFAKA